MRENAKLYIAYGSNMNVEQMKYRCPEAKLITSLYLENFRLRFKGDNNYSVATIEPAADHLVPVTVWEIMPGDEESLDLFEGYPLLYRKETIELKLGKKRFVAMYYVMNSNGYSYGFPSRQYFQTILEGYLDAGFDPKLLHQAVAENVEREVMAF